MHFIFRKKTIYNTIFLVRSVIKVFGQKFSLSREGSGHLDYFILFYFNSPDVILKL